MANFVENSKLIYEGLRSIGLCMRCCLRYLGEREIDSHIQVEECTIKKGFEEQRNEDNSPEAKVAKSYPCSACLGLLQLSTEAVVAKISEEVLNANYDSKNFTCALSLPICFQLRAHSVWLYLKDAFPEPFSLPDIHEVSHVTSIKDVWKWLIAPRIGLAINKELDSGLCTDFFLAISIVYPGEEEECSTLISMHKEEYSKRRQQKKKYHGHMWTRKCVANTLQLTDPSNFKKCFPSPPVIPPKFIEYKCVSCKHNSVFLAGRYNKYSRNLSQTPWVIDGERRMDSSVQEIISDPLVSICRADGVKFLSSGREDVDVRMLGRGRPFACELLNPHRVIFSEEDIRNIEQSINNSNLDVFVRDLQFVTKDDLQELKLGEASKTKIYHAVCIAHKPLESGILENLMKCCPIILNQKTPIRVLHRRPLSTRPRTIHEIHAKPLDYSDSTKTLFTIRLKTQAGTYVKEFVHGDFGRTQPCLSNFLNCDVDILALDVEEIELDWPKKINYPEEPENICK